MRGVNGCAATTKRRVCSSLVWICWCPHRANGFGDGGDRLELLGSFGFRAAIPPTSANGTLPTTSKASPRDRNVRYSGTKIRATTTGTTTIRRLVARS
jgi:hypothetical protein